MKKTHGVGRALRPVPSIELEAWPNGALLARLKRLRWCEAGSEQSDLSPEEIASVSHAILFKSDPAWRSAYDDLKHVLAHREHAGN